MRPPVALLGPTASGKSDVAMAAAAAVPDIEIVAVDAMQVYRGMDVGTAKPTAADRAAVVHHCLDLADPSDEMSVTEFRRAYDAAIATIAARPPAGHCWSPAPACTSRPPSTVSSCPASGRKCGARSSRSPTPQRSTTD